MSELNPPTHLTEEDTAALLRMSTNALAHWRRKGLAPPHSKAGRLVIYRIADVHEWVASSQGEAVLARTGKVDTREFDNSFENKT